MSHATTAAVTATDLFSGAGGASTGLAQAGVDVRICANHWDLAVRTHKINHPDTEHRLADLAETDWRTFPSTDILWASPSCVWHARSGGRKAAPLATELAGSDPGSIDRATAFAVVEAAEVHRYPVILIENVPEFAKWSLYNWWLAGLRELGYTTTQMVLDAADFGHAQRRKRLFIVATQAGVELDLTAPVTAPVFTDSILDLSNLGKPVSRTLYIDDQINQVVASGSTAPHLATYRRNARAQPVHSSVLPTVTAGGNHHAMVTIDHSGTAHHRMLTIAERARAQGFPDNYQLLGNQSQQRRMVGNAVPVGIARWLGQQTISALAA